MLSVVLACDLPGQITKRLPGFARNRIVRQFKASAAYGANATAQTGG
jgi:hypothetical protein